MSIKVIQNSARKSVLVAENISGYGWRDEQVTGIIYMRSSLPAIKDVEIRFDCKQDIATLIQSLEYIADRMAQ